MTDGTIAEDLAKEMKQTSVAEFFERNRHLLGYDSKIKAMLTCIKEIIDNCIDACEEMIYKSKKKGKDYVLPEINVRVRKIGGERYVVRVIDNGTGIVKGQIPHVFTRLLYGSKFYKEKQGRGQQGIGVSAAVLYSQLTTGKATHVVSKTSLRSPAYFYDLRIDTSKNRPEIVNSGMLERFKWDHGTQVEMEVVGTYLNKGEKSIYEYLRRTSIVNPHVRITFIDPEGKKIIFPRTSESVPKESKSIKPHPYGIEVGDLIRISKLTKSKTVKSFLTQEFSRVSSRTAKEILNKVGVNLRHMPGKISRDQAAEIVKLMQATKFMAPPLDCLSPIGSNTLRKSLSTGLDAEFVTTVSRNPSVYKGRPFLIEAAIAFGGSLSTDKQVKIIRFANKMPLQYDAGACAITEAISGIDWRRYGLNQTGGRGMPTGPAIILVHMGSTWIPYTSEGKSAIAHYNTIMKEMRLALQDCARDLRIYLSRKHKALKQQERISTFIKYSNESVKSLVILTGEKEEGIRKSFDKLIESNTGTSLAEAGGSEEEKSKSNDEFENIDEFIKEGDE